MSIIEVRTHMVRPSEKQLDSERDALEASLNEGSIRSFRVLLAEIEKLDHVLNQVKLIEETTAGNKAVMSVLRAELRALVDNTSAFLAHREGKISPGM